MMFENNTDCSNRFEIILKKRWNAVHVSWNLKKETNSLMVRNLSFACLVEKAIAWFFVSVPIRVWNCLHFSNYIKQHLLVYCVFVMEKLDVDCGESNCLEIFCFFFISENHIWKLDLFAIVWKDFCFAFRLCIGKV